MSLEVPQTWKFITRNPQWHLKMGWGKEALVPSFSNLE